MKTLTLAELAMITAAALSVSAQAQQSPRLYAPDGTYLGNLNTNRFDPNSVSNPYSQYGSQYSPNSINNPYGQYGRRCTACTARPTHPAKRDIGA